MSSLANILAGNATEANLNANQTVFDQRFPDSVEFEGFKTLDDINPLSEIDKKFLIAASRGNVRKAEYLISKGANVNVRGIDSSTPLMLAVHNNHIDMAKLLLDKGVDVNYQNKEGNTALLHAVNNKNIEIAKLLIKEGANVHIPNKLNITAFDLAVSQENLEMIGFLTKNGAARSTPYITDEQEKRIKRSSELLVAAIEGDFDKAKSLISEGVFIDVKDESFVTPLMHAVHNNHIDMAKLLLDKGVNIYDKDVNGRTAQELADMYGNKEMSKLLEEREREIRLKEKYSSNSDRSR